MIQDSQRVVDDAGLTLQRCIVQSMLNEVVESRVLLTQVLVGTGSQTIVEFIQDGRDPFIRVVGDSKSCD